jgi:hypothetical protein
MGTQGLLDLEADDRPILDHNFIQVDLRGTVFHKDII